MSNIYKFEDAIDEHLRALQGYPAWIKSVFYNYNKMHYEKLLRSLRLQEKFMKNVQRRLQFLNVNRERYNDYFKKVNDYLFNSAHVSNSRIDIRNQILEDIISLADDYDRTFDELKLNRDDLVVSLNEVNPQGQVLNLEEINELIRRLNDMHILLGHIRDIVFNLKALEDRKLPTNEMFDLKGRLDHLHDNAPPPTRDTALHFKNLIDYLYY
jgi:DNA-binding ferritin-like protein (Dps family)